MGTETGPLRWGDAAAGLLPDRPQVFLESTVIAQGLPYPVSLEAARACEEAVRRAGAVPAVVAVIDGIVRCGLSVDEVRRMAAGPGRR